MYNFDCKFRYDNESPSVCKYQSTRLGHVVYTSSLFCNSSCPKHVYEHGQEDVYFLKKCYHRRYDKDFLDKVIKKYQKQTQLIVPDIWLEVNNVFCTLLKQESWFVDVGLTGSSIVSGVENHRDIDVVISINNIDQYLEWRKVNKTILPTHINSIKIDYYFYTDICNQFFVSLWPNQKLVYIHHSFLKNTTFPDGYNIQHNLGINSEILDLDKVY